MPQTEQLKPETGQQIEEPPKKTEKPKEIFETSEDLSKFREQKAQQIEKKSAEVIESGSKIEPAIISIDGGPEDVAAGKAAVAEVQKDIANLSSETLKNITQEKIVETSNGLKDDYTPEQLTALRAKTKEDYGEGLVSKFHKKVENVGEYEKAQEEAYNTLNEKIEAGAVKPDSIQSDMLDHLELKNKPEIAVNNVDQIAQEISTEMKELTDKGLIKESEAILIQAEAEKFSQIYGEAFPGANLQQVFEVTRDNARKLAYQTERDKQVFSGSDHGTRHILEGNMTMANSMVESLGDKISAKDKILIHQIIIDHDLGYTVGVAQAKGSFDASKDHPLFSAKFIESNQEYYKQKFGEDGYEMIKNGILQHSKPKSEYNTPTDSEKGFNPDIIRSITSTVDALGVTAETKCPAFFREPKAINVLQKVKLFADTHDGKVSPDALAMYKNELREIADSEPDAGRKEGYYNAIENQFNPVTAEMTLGQYAGVLKEIKMTEREGKIVPLISMEISKAQALLGNLFGDKMATKAFVKAMEDFGVNEETMKDMAKTLKQIKEAKTDEEKQPLLEKLKYSSDKADFEFAPDFAEANTEVEQVFEESSNLMIRNEVRELSKILKSPENRNGKNLELVFKEFNTAVNILMDEGDLIKFMEIQGAIMDNIDKPENFDKALTNFNTFTTNKEKKFMGI